MSVPHDRIQLRHPDPAKVAPAICRIKYEAVRAALLAAIPRDGQGVPFKDLAARVTDLLPRETLDRIGSVGWYTTAVKLDLEAQGLIERVPGARPQRVRRVE